MEQTRVVLDTHIFLKGVPALSETPADPPSDEPEVKLLKHIIEVCHQIAVNDDILKEYVQIAPRRQISALLIRDKIAELKRKGKAVKKGKYAGRRPIAVGPEQDRCFIEVAIASQARYVVTNDPDFRRFAEIARQEHFTIASPSDYLAQEGGR